MWPPSRRTWPPPRRMPTDPVTIGTQLYSRHDALEALAARLHALPALVYETRSVPLGLSRGLRFGLVQHPQGAPEVYVEGALRRSAPLARDVHGPRAILNAVERLIGSAAAERDKARRDLEIAQGQLRDYEARLGAGFPHATYLEALTAPPHPAGGRAVQHDARGGRGIAAHGGRPCRTPQGPARRPYGRSRSRAVRPTPHGDRRRGHHHAYSPARAGRDRAPAGRRAVPGGSRDPCTAACHHTAAAGHAGPGTPGTLAASPAVAPVLGTAGWRDRRRFAPPSPLGAVRIAGAPGGPGRLRHPAGPRGGACAPPWASSASGESPQRSARLLVLKSPTDAGGWLPGA